MGYRSEVKLCMKKDAYKELKKRTRKVAGKDGEDLMQHLDVFHDCKDGYVVFGWNWLKWYGEYDSVRTIIDFFDELKTPRQMIIIGEEYDDIEVVNFDGDNDEPCPYHIDLSRAIEIC